MFSEVHSSFFKERKPDGLFLSHEFMAYWSCHKGTLHFNFRPPYVRTVFRSAGAALETYNWRASFGTTSRDRQTETHTDTRQAKNPFSWRLSVSSQKMCSALLNFEFLTVFQYFHSFYEHESKSTFKTLEISCVLRRAYIIILSLKHSSCPACGRVHELWKVVWREFCENMAKISFWKLVIVVIWSVAPTFNFFYLFSTLEKA